MLESRLGPAEGWDDGLVRQQGVRPGGAAASAIRPAALRQASWPVLPIGSGRPGERGIEAAVRHDRRHHAGMRTRDRASHAHAPKSQNRRLYASGSGIVHATSGAREFRPTTAMRSPLGPRRMQATRELADPCPRVAPRRDGEGRSRSFARPRSDYGPCLHRTRSSWKSSICAPLPSRYAICSTTEN